MEVELFQDIATIVTFIAPGYFSIQVYSLMHAKKDREFSRILVESVVYSLPLVALSSVVWQLLFGNSPNSLEIGYVALLVGFAVIAGVIVGLLRMRWPIKHIARLLHIEEPNDDFLKEQLRRIDATKPSANTVTVQLKSGATFSGTVESMTRQIHNDRPMYFSFANVAWYDELKHTWDEREGNIIISRDEVEYIETGRLLDN